MRKRTGSLRDVIKEYLEDAINISKTKILMPLIHLRKGKPLNKQFLKKAINRIIQGESSFL